MDEVLLGQLRSIDPKVTEWIAARLAQHGVFDAAAVEIAADADSEVDRAREVLEHLVQADVLTKAERTACPQCQQPLSTGDEQCPRCQLDLVGLELSVTVSYRRVTARGRDVPWMVLIHGMNTRGAWQEEFSWRAAVLHGRSIPVFSYKYGVLRPGVCFASRRNRLVQRTIEMIRELAGDVEQVHLGTRPDVIAHSFGTWLIAHALLEDPTLAIGRLILTGSILPCDFEWNRVSGQHLGVLNHCAEKDRVVRFARFFIADSGPSGVGGFSDDEICQVTTEAWGHRDYFKSKANLQRAFETVWTPFLTAPDTGDDGKSVGP